MRGNSTPILRPVISSTSSFSVTSPGRDRGDLAAVAQHRDAVGDLLDLAHAVGDVDDADPGLLQLGDQVEQLRRLGFRQRRRRLVQNEQADVGEERLGDLHHLLVGARQFANLAVGVEVESEILDDLDRAGPHGRAD